MHICSMETGQRHSDAKDLICPRIGSMHTVHSTSVTNSRFAMLGSAYRSHMGTVYVWDWRTGELLLVSGCLPSVATFD